MKVYQRLAHAFKAEGVTDVFGLLGSATMHWADELNRIGVRTYEVRHEGFGLGMADGWARATNTVGVCHATSGPGVTQLASALVTASRASSTVVVFCAEDAITDYDGVHHYDQATFAATCESGYVRVDAADVVDEAVRKAFQRARLESRPILLSAPVDIQLKTFEDADEPYVPTGEFFGRPMPLAPNPDAIERAADLIAASRKPVIIVGRGAYWAKAGDAVLKLDGRIGSLLGTSLCAKSWLTDVAPCHAGIAGQYGTRTAIELFGESDCVIAVGASMNRYTMMGGYLFPEAKFVHINTKPHIVMATGRSAECYVQSDARLGLEALEAALARRKVSNTGYHTAEIKDRLSRNYVDDTQFEVEPGTVDAREACKMIDAMIPANVNITGAMGSCSGFSNMHITRARPMVLSGHFFGCIGQFLSASMGAVIASGNKPMLMLDGDCGMMMHLSNFDVAARYNLPLLAIVLNDESLGSERHHMVAKKLNYELSNVPTPDIGAVATALGGRGCLARTLDELRAGLEQWLARPGPMIIDLRISRNVLPMQVRRMHHGKNE